MNRCFQFGSFPNKIEIIIFYAHDLSYFEPPQLRQLYEPLSSNKRLHTSWQRPVWDANSSKKDSAINPGVLPKVRFRQFSQTQTGWFRKHNKPCPGDFPNLRPLERCSQRRREWRLLGGRRSKITDTRVGSASIITLSPHRHGCI